MVEDVSVLRWGIGRRMAFLDSCLFWMGQVNRNDLVRSFGVSVPQASADLARYRDLAPANMVYDATRKAYVRSEAYEPAFGGLSADQVLEALAASAAGGADVADRAPWLDGVSVSQVVPVARRDVRPDVLRRVLEAVRGERALEIVYQSFSRAEPTRRWVEPHSLAFDGERWHVRSFCCENRDFRDFVLSRITAAGDDRAAGAPRSADFEWSCEVALRLAPNPTLAPGVRRGLELDYGMRRGVALMRVRICFVYYVERRLGLDLEAAVPDPGRRQLVLLNGDEVERARARARERTAAALVAARF